MSIDILYVNRDTVCRLTVMPNCLLALNQDLFSSKLFDETIFRQCGQSTKCHFDEVTFSRNGSLDEVFDEVSRTGFKNQKIRV